MVSHRQQLLHFKKTLDIYEQIPGGGVDGTALFPREGVSGNAPQIAGTTLSMPAK